MKLETFSNKAQKISTWGLLFLTGAAWVFYGSFGRQIIRALYNSRSDPLVGEMMEGRVSTPLENYYRQADYLMLWGSLWLITLYFALLVVIRKPRGVLLAACSLLLTSFLFFCFFENFPSVIKPLHLDTFSYYYAYKVRYIYDKDLVFREKPFKHEIIPGFKGSHYSPIYEIDVDPVTIDWITDENGFRNSRTTDSSDIVVMGDSFMEFGNNEGDTFVKRLETKLPGLTVTNLAKSGYGPFQYLEVLKRFGLNYKPKYAFFSFYEGNDLQDTEDYSKWKKGEELSKDVDWVYRLPLDSFLGRYEVAIKTTMSSIARRVSAATDLGGKKIADARGDAYRIHPDLALLRLGSNRYQKKLFIVHNNTQSTVEILQSEKAQELKTVLADFKAVCEENGIVPIMIYVPTAAHIYAEYSTERSGQSWLEKRDDQIAAKENMTNAVKQLVQDLDISLIDLTPVFELAAKEGKLLYYPLDSHWNSEGRETAAAFVADTLQSKSFTHVMGNERQSRDGS